MNPSLKIIALAAFFLIGWSTIQIQSGYSAIPLTQDCACGNSACGDGCGGERQRRCGCQKCSGKRASRKCPECECEFCTLEVTQVEEEKTCFKTEQKIVCVPKVRMPWQNCCPGISKTRTVNVLKTHKYKCPACKYTWSVNEPELTFSQTSNESTPPVVEPQAEQSYQPPVRAYQPPIQIYPSSAQTNQSPVQPYQAPVQRSYQYNQNPQSTYQGNQNRYQNRPYQPSQPTFVPIVPVPTYAPSGSGTR